jgi:hypothetical protein
MKFRKRVGVVIVITIVITQTCLLYISGQGSLLNDLMTSFRYFESQIKQFYEFTYLHIQESRTHMYIIWWIGLDPCFYPLDELINMIHLQSVGNFKAKFFDTFCRFYLHTSFGLLLFGL